MRSAGLDLVKWTAMLTMVADHLRFIWPEAEGLFVLGRLAFPLFCLAIAVNVGRARAELFHTGQLCLPFQHGAPRHPGPLDCRCAFGVGRRRARVNVQRQ